VAVIALVFSHGHQCLLGRKKCGSHSEKAALSLLHQRLRIALEIGGIKKQMGTKIYDPKREKEVLTRLKLRNRGPLRSKDLGKIFRMAMKVCRGAQKVVNSEVPFW
jgi:chorismate mutase